MRVIKQTILAMISCLLVAGSLFAQQPQDVVGLTDFPAPPWPANGVVPAELKDKYVFLDLAKNEYIVAYPENLASPTFEKDGPGALKITHLELLRNVQPAVTVSIAAVQGGKLRYTYNVANATGAKQSLDQWSMVVPNTDGTVIKGPDGWFAIVQHKRDFKVRDPQWIKTGGAAVWSFKKPETVIQPGDKKTGFEIDSDLRPGFTLGYFRKAESVDVTVAASGAGYPPKVKEQVDQLLSVEYNSKTMPVIGPKFDKSVDDKTVAADFLKGIDTLTKTAVLNPSSDFVKAATDAMKGVQTNGNGATAKIAAAPQGPVETDIFNAIKLSLHMN
jgi:hypothetical protein